MKHFFTLKNSDKWIFCIVYGMIGLTAFRTKADTYTVYTSGAITVINLSTNTFSNTTVEEIYNNGTEGNVWGVNPNEDNFTPGSIGTASGVVLGTIDNNTEQWNNLGASLWPIRYLRGRALDIHSHVVYSANVLPYAGNGMTGTLFFFPGNIITVDDTRDGTPSPNQSPNVPPCGMPAWSVSEPYISLWLKDEPLGYQPALGPRASFELAFKQREFNSGYNPALFGVGTRWNCSWLSYVTHDFNTNNIVSFPGGGLTTYYTTNDYLTQTTLTGDTTNGFTLYYPDGSKDVYGFLVTNSSGTFLEAMLTQYFDAQSNKLTLNYFSYTPSAPVVRLKNVVDGDGRTNTITYATNNAYSTNLITKVTDPFGRSTTLSYNTNGDLTNIVDVMTNSTSFNYDTNDWVTNMTTPYGTTSFTLTDSGTNLPPNGRSVLITRPDNSHEYYLYQDNAPGIVSAYPTNQVPAISP